MPKVKPTKKSPRKKPYNRPLSNTVKNNNLVKNNNPVKTEIMLRSKYLKQVSVNKGSITNINTRVSHRYYANLKHKNPTYAQIIHNYTQEAEEGEEILIYYNVINWLLKHIRDDSLVDTLPIEVKQCTLSKEALLKQIESAKILYKSLHEFPKIQIANTINVFRGFKCNEIKNLDSFKKDDLYTVPRFISTSVFLETTERFYATANPQCVMAIQIPQETILPYISTELIHTRYDTFVKKNITQEAEVLLPLGAILKYAGKIKDEKANGTYRTIYCFDLMGFEKKTDTFWKKYIKAINEKYTDIDKQIVEYQKQQCNSN